MKWNRLNCRSSWPLMAILPRQSACVRSAHICSRFNEPANRTDVSQRATLRGSRLCASWRILWPVVECSASRSSPARQRLPKPDDVLHRCVERRLARVESPTDEELHRRPRATILVVAAELLEAEAAVGPRENVDAARTIEG